MPRLSCCDGLIGATERGKVLKVADLYMHFIKLFITIMPSLALVI